MEAEDTAPKRKPGRPRGSVGKHGAVRPKPATNDPLTLVQRNFEMVDWAQSVIRREMQRAMQDPNPRVAESLSKRLVDVSIALVRSIDGMKKAGNALDELQKALSPAQLLEAAIKKLEKADPGEIRRAIKRLKSALDGDEVAIFTGADALAALGDDDE